MFCVILFLIFRRRVSSQNTLLHVLSHFQDFDFKPNFRRYFDRRHEQHIAITLCKVSRDVTFLLTSSRWREHDLQPAGAALYILPGIRAAPALGETQSQRVRVKGSVIGGGVPDGGVEAGQVPAEHLHAEAGRDLEHAEGARVGHVQGGRVDEEGHLGPVVNPDPRLIATQDQA